MTEFKERNIGKCPNCGIELDSNDIEVIWYKSGRPRHYAHVCQKCNTIIGFSTIQHQA